MVLTDDSNEGVVQESVPQTVQSELEETERVLRETTLMIEQSQQEFSKLSQRNAAITAHLQQVQAKMESLPVGDVRMAYESALDAQQRLFVMRGQLEKLQSDRIHLEKHKITLEKMIGTTNPDGTSQQKSAKVTTPGMEMIINAQESERQRLSRQMHDGPAQALSNFILQTEIAMRLMDVDPAQARNELASLKAAAMTTFQKVRNFIFELRPMMLDDLGLVPTIKRYIDTFKEQTGLEIGLAISGKERRLEPYVEVMIFRSMQELLGNAVRHSQATHVKVQLDMGDAFVKVSVDDNGKGFDTEVIRQGNSLGLKLIQERAEMLGGTLEADSVIGKGTRIAFSVPARSV
jgi:two-component system, NarL family, sensor histidine kinase DegS